MPKKTKREKVIAAYHKKMKLLERKEEIIPRELPKIRTLNVGVVENTYMVSYFFSDLKKSVLLILIIITLEIGFYFATINNYFGLRM